MVEGAGPAATSVVNVRTGRPHTVEETSPTIVPNVPRAYAVRAPLAAISTVPVNGADIALKVCIAAPDPGPVQTTFGRLTIDAGIGVQPEGGTNAGVWGAPAAGAEESSAQLHTIV